MRDEDDAVDRDVLRLDERDQRLEVLRRLVDVLVTGNENVGGWCLSHHGSPFDSVPRLAGGSRPSPKLAMNLMAVMLGRNVYAAALVVTKLERPVTSIGGLRLPAV